MKNTKIQIILLIIFTAFFSLSSEALNEQQPTKGNNNSNETIRNIIENEKIEKETNKILKRIKCLRDSIQIKVIYRKLPHSFCGVILTSSLTLGIIKKQDTIGIISECDMNNKIKIQDTITVRPCKTMSVDLGLIGNDNLKLIKKYRTYFGEINQE
jgi:hypothetical protein